MSKPIHELIPEVMTAVGAIAKTQRNEQQGFNFRGIDTIVNAVSPAFREFGVFVVPKLISAEHSTAPTRSGGSVNIVHLVVEYRFIGPLGDSIETVVAAESFDSGDKATAKAMSVALRTALLQTLLLPTDEPEPDSTTYERAQSQPTTLTPLQWITLEGEKRFKTWDKALRNSHYKAAREALAIDRINSMEDAKLILDHMENAYQRIQESLEEGDGY